MTKTKRPARVFFTADSHFGHRGVIAMCGRPFADVAEMNACLIDAWNSRVGRNDTVWFLGDLAMGASPAECAALFACLNGVKHLVRGNHDNKRVLDLRWASQHDLVQTTVDGSRLMLCHYG